MSPVPVFTFVLLTRLLPTIDVGPFRDLSFDEACNAAQAEKKIVLIDFFTTWCGPCKMLDKTTWEDVKVKAWLKEKTVPLRIDAEKEKKLAERFEVHAYPTILLLKPDGKELDRLVGYKSAEDFLADAQAALGGKDSVSRAKEKLDQVGSDNPMERMNYGQALAQKGKKKEALDEYLWCFDHGTANPAFAGVRLSFLLSEIEQLGRNYPPALAELKSRRDSAEQVLLGKKKAPSGSKGFMGFGMGGEFNSAMEFTAINRTLGENEKTLTVYRTLREKGEVSSIISDMFLREIIDQLIEEKEYEEIISAAGDVQAKVEAEILQHKEMVAMMARMKRPVGTSDPEDQLKRHLIKESAKYYEALLGVEKQSKAAKVATQLIDFDNSEETFVCLVHHAVRAGNSDAAQSLVTKAKDILTDDQVKRLQKESTKVPKERNKHEE